MKFIKLFKHDFSNGILKNRFFWISTILISIMFCIDFSVKANALKIYGFSYNYGDVIMSIYGGMKEYIPLREEHFVFPVKWVILILAQFFGTLNYPYNSINTFGKQILIRTEGRSLWWFSKCAWNVTYSILYHEFILLISLMYCLISGFNINMNVNSDLLMFIFNLQEYQLNLNMINIHVYILLTPLLMTISVNLIQMTISLFVNRTFSFLAMTCITVISAYLMKPYIIGNYSMMIRSTYVINNGIDFNNGIIIASVLFAIGLIIGLIKFNRYDILNS